MSASACDDRSPGNVIDHSLESEVAVDAADAIMTNPTFLGLLMTSWVKFLFAFDVYAVF